MPSKSGRKRVRRATSRLAPTHHDPQYENLDNDINDDDDGNENMLNYGNNKGNPNDDYKSNLNGDTLNTIIN